MTPDLPEDDPPFDADKVARLQAAIARGAYRIDCDALAGAMMGFACADWRQKSDGIAPSKN